MPHSVRLLREDVWRQLAHDQSGVLARHQLIGLGLTADQARQWVRSGRWRTLLPGVWCTFTGPVPDRARIWGAVLHAGPAALVTGRTALWLAGAIDGPLPYPIHIVIPNRRQNRSVPGVRITRSRTTDAEEPGRGSPPARAIEAALLDACDDARSPELVLDLVFRVCQRRLSTAGRISAALSRRTRARWRRLLADVLADVGSGVWSRLEQRYLRDVERAHGLPGGERNRPENAGSTRYRDVRYPKWRLVVELDGRGAHPDDERFRDFRRDNRLTVDGDSSLRYGWHDVALRPCEVAQQAISVLQANGWPSHPHLCTPTCPIARAAITERIPGA